LTGPRIVIDVIMTHHEDVGTGLPLLIRAWRLQRGGRDDKFARSGIFG